MSAATRSFVTTLCVLTLCTLEAMADLPRYSFPVGRKLAWSCAGQSKSSDGEMDSSSKGSLQVTVVRENADGSRRLLIRNVSSYRLGKKDDKETQDVSLTYADIFPDGRILPNPSFNLDSGPPIDILPPLPADEKQIAIGWSADNAEKLERIEYTSAKSGDKQSIITSKTSGPMITLYALSYESTFHFDQARGIMTNIELKWSQDRSFHIKGVTRNELSSDVMLPTAEVAQLAADHDVLLTATQQYRQKVKEAGNAPDKQVDAFAHATALMSKARDTVASTDMKGECDRLLKEIADFAKYATESSDEFKDIKNKAAPDWSSTDTAGNVVKLADFKGKVVVMDFWYRGCGFCMYAMPQVKQLAADYKDKPVVVLGMSTDRDDKDSQAVIDVFALAHPTIKAVGINEKYGIHGFPTMVILDQQGIVRDVHVGYSKTLREDVAKKIDALLTSSP